MKSYATEYWDTQYDSSTKVIVCQKCRTTVYADPLPGSFGACQCSPPIQFVELETLFKAERDKSIKKEEEAIKEKEAITVASKSGWPSDEKTAKGMNISVNIYREFTKTIVPAYVNHSSDWDASILGDDMCKCAISYSKFYDTSTAKRDLLNEWRGEDAKDVITALVKHFTDHSIPL
jgi:hypothetical protein